MSSVYILTYSGRIKNVDKKIFKVLTPEAERECYVPGVTLQEHIYVLQCGEINIEVRCPEIRMQENAEGDGYLILPEFLIPGRPYLIYVYLYAIATYCFNPTMGQREAAEITRVRFGLETFSHTTLGRAMKKLETLINEIKSEPQNKEVANKTTAAETTGKKFPSVEQTKERRIKVGSYLMEACEEDGFQIEETIQADRQQDYRRPPYMGAFIDACHSIVFHTFLKYHCLLL